MKSLVLAVTLAMSGPACAAIIDFEQLGDSLSRSFPSPLVVGEYEFTGGGGGGGDYIVFGKQSLLFAGSTALMPYGDDFHALRRRDGRPFDLVSLDFAETDLRDDRIMAAPSWTGHKVDGSIVQRDLRPNGTPGFQTATFSRFTGLRAVTFDLSSDYVRTYQYDNIVVARAPAPVPIPASLGLFLAALALAGLVLRPRKA